MSSSSRCRVGDNVNPLVRPAGVPVPEGAGQGRQHAGFHQVESQVVKVGMAAVMTCASKLWIVIPMVVTGVQDLIAAGQIRAGEQLIDAQQVTRPGNNPGVRGADLRGQRRQRHPAAALASMRLGKNGEATRGMLACKSPADAMAVQSRWIEETLRDYVSEMSKLVSLCSNSMDLGSRAGD